MSDNECIEAVEAEQDLSDQQCAEDQLRDSEIENNHEEIVPPPNFATYMQQPAYINVVHNLVNHSESQVISNAPVFTAPNGVQGVLNQSIVNNMLLQQQNITYQSQSQILENVQVYASNNGQQFAPSNTSISNVVEQRLSTVHTQSQIINNVGVYSMSNDSSNCTQPLVFNNVENHFYNPHYQQIGVNMVESTSNLFFTQNKPHLEPLVVDNSPPVYIQPVCIVNNPAPLVVSPVYTNQVPVSNVAGSQLMYLQHPSGNNVMTPQLANIGNTPSLNMQLPQQQVTPAQIVNNYGYYSSSSSQQQQLVHVFGPETTQTCSLMQFQQCISEQTQGQAISSNSSRVIECRSESSETMVLVGSERENECISPDLNAEEHTSQRTPSELQGNNSNEQTSSVPSQTLKRVKHSAKQRKHKNVPLKFNPKLSLKAKKRAQGNIQPNDMPLSSIPEPAAERTFSNECEPESCETILPVGSVTAADMVMQQLPIQFRDEENECSPPTLNAEEHTSQRTASGLQGNSSNQQTISVTTQTLNRLKHQAKQRKHRNLPLKLSTKLPLKKKKRAKCSIHLHFHEAEPPLDPISRKVPVQYFENCNTSNEMHRNVPLNLNTGSLLKKEISANGDMHYHLQKEPLEEISQKMPREYFEKCKLALEEAVGNVESAADDSSGDSIIEVTNIPKNLQMSYTPKRSRSSSSSSGSSSSGSSGSSGSSSSATALNPLSLLKKEIRPKCDMHYHLQKEEPSLEEISQKMPREYFEKRKLVLEEAVGKLERAAEDSSGDSIIEVSKIPKRLKMFFSSKRSRSSNSSCSSSSATALNTLSLLKKEIRANCDMHYHLQKEEPSLEEISQKMPREYFEKRKLALEEAVGNVESAADDSSGDSIIEVTNIPKSLQMSYTPKRSRSSSSSCCSSSSSSATALNPLSLLKKEIRAKCDMHYHLQKEEPSLEEISQKMPREYVEKRKLALEEAVGKLERAAEDSSGDSIIEVTKIPKRLKRFSSSKRCRSSSSSSSSTAFVQPSTSRVKKPSKSRNESLFTSRIGQPSTSKIEQPLTSRIEQSSVNVTRKRPKASIQKWHSVRRPLQ